MSSNAVVLSPYRTLVTESNNEFQSIELQRATVIPPAAPDHVRFTAGPAGFASPTLAARGEGDDQAFMFTSTFFNGVDGYVTGGAPNTSWTMGDTQYSVAVNGFVCTVAVSMSWSAKTPGSTGGNFKVAVPGAPRIIAVGVQGAHPNVVFPTAGSGSVIEGLATPFVLFDDSTGGTNTMVIELSPINTNGTSVASITGANAPASGTIRATVTYFIDRLT